MTRVFGGRFAAGGLLILAAVGMGAQEPQGEAKGKEAKEPRAYSPPPLFADSKPLTFTVTAPFREIKRQRVGQPTYRWGTITYTGDSGEVRVPLRVRGRGIWRRKNCDVPPLMLNFVKDSSKKSEFRRLDRARLALACRNNDDFDQYLLQEFTLYRVQRLLTPYSYNVRLARVTYVDSEKKDTLMTRNAFIFENDDDFSARVGAKAVTEKGAGPDDLHPYESALFGVFQYFVGNTDFSIRELHNVTLLFKDTTYVPVAYDFDWSGAVSARYAIPNPILKIKRVSERIMRGYCTTPAMYEKVFQLFRDRKDAIYAIYSDSLATGLKPDVVKQTLKYFDDFYETINDPRRAKREIVDACLGGAA